MPIYNTWSSDHTTVNPNYRIIVIATFTVFIHILLVIVNCNEICSKEKFKEIQKIYDAFSKELHVILIHEGIIATKEFIQHSRDVLRQIIDKKKIKYNDIQAQFVKAMGIDKNIAKSIVRYLCNDLCSEVSDGYVCLREYYAEFVTREIITKKERKKNN